MSCRGVQSWLHLDTESLSEAERLVLEDHLVGCERCRRDRSQLLTVKRIGASLPSEAIGPRGHARAIAQAMMQGRTSDAAAKRRLVPWWAFAAAGGAVAAAIALYVAFRSDRAVSPAPAIDLASAPSEHLSSPPTTERQNVATPAPVHDRGVVVTEGTLVHGEAALPLDSELPVDVTLRAATNARVVAASMTVVVASSSYIRRSAIDRELILQSGGVEVTGDASRIATAAFMVEIHGDATVSPRRVTVRRGFVRIVAPDGRVLAAKVVAPLSWQQSETQATKPTAAALLEAARIAFNARDYATAEHNADAALDAGPTRAQTAEARTLLAECVQATGKIEDAIARYEAIATRFSDLAAGETALFAAARLQAGRDRDAARKLFERYLGRYPSGRFADDAQRQLRAH